MLKIEITRTNDHTSLTKSLALYSDLISPENEAVWQAYLFEKIRECVSPEAMKSPLFQKLQEQELQREQDELQRKEQEAYLKYRDSLVRIPKLSFIPDGLMVDYAEVYGFGYVVV